MRDLGDDIRTDASILADSGDTIQYSDGRILWSRGYFGSMHIAAVCIDQQDISKGPTNVCA
jgi:hypothetical protein